mmetsp:Transcript_7019/g.15314  ORF Transcript_7019/g.15314 Transcript_7019/m.15314 type:complete len:393 (-) Transcript_7019:265-1443(-)|eukprot:CAMPEP_0178559926 /NCGR_PEP_ID=MMETSP0697-20121206/11220_1 /TAXON_ID=265572 /ORGANISM="Extubocellulus spinifer, Strain CCMP396" /LENGTH=392 /DNA_ID=CAMNT_0020193161 /DNA_START=169 /DNA_END=1347 /DNA_ORIENTATION=-
MSPPPTLLLVQLFVSAAMSLTLTVAGCVLSRRISKTATSTCSTCTFQGTVSTAATTTVAGEQGTTITEKAARHYINLCTVLPLIVSACSVSFVGSLGDPFAFYPPVICLTMASFVVWQHCTAYPTIRDSYRDTSKQAPQLVGLLSILLWAGAFAAWMMWSYAIYDNTHMKQYHPYDYLGPGRIVSYFKSNEEDADSTIRTMKIEWLCPNNSATACDYEVDVICSYNRGEDFLTFYYDNARSVCHVYSNSGDGGLDCDNFAGTVEAESDAGAGAGADAVEVGPYVDILANCTDNGSGSGSGSSNGSGGNTAACSVPRLLVSSYSHELRLPRRYAIQGWILTGLAAGAFLVAASMFRNARQEQQQQKVNKPTMLGGHGANVKLLELIPTNGSLE